MTDKVDYSDFREFSEMPRSLRAGAAAGMDVRIHLEPESAIALAEILEAYDLMLKADIVPYAKLKEYARLLFPKGKG